MYAMSSRLSSAGPIVSIWLHAIALAPERRAVVMLVMLKCHFL